MTMKERIVELEAEVNRLRNVARQAAEATVAATSEVNFLRRILSNMTDVRSPIRQNIDRNTGDRASTVSNTEERKY